MTIHEPGVPGPPPETTDGVRRAIREGAVCDSAYLTMNLLAAVIASYGLLADNGTAVIGAMVVAQLLGPIMGIALALVDGDSPLLRRGLLTLVVGMGLVLLVGFLIGGFHRDIPPTDQLLSRTSPQFSDLMIALAGGAAAAYATVSPRVGTALVGVAVATAMVPPLCAAAMFLGRGEHEWAGGAFFLAGVNIVSIQFAASVVLWASGYHQVTRPGAAGSRVLIRHLVSIGLLTIMGVILSVHTHHVVRDQVFAAQLSRALKDELHTYPGYSLIQIQQTMQEGRRIIGAVVRGPRLLSPTEVAAIQSALPAAPDGVPLTLRVRFVEVEVVSADGLPDRKGPR